MPPLPVGVYVGTVPCEPALVVTPDVLGLIPFDESLLSGVRSCDRFVAG